MKSACAAVYCVSFVVCPALHYFTRIIKKLWVLKFVLFYSLHVFQKHFPLEDQLNTVMNVHRYGRTLITSEISRWIFKYLTRKFMKTCPVGTELFHAGAETYRETGKRTDRQTLPINIHLSKFF